MGKQHIAPTILKSHTLFVKDFLPNKKKSKFIYTFFSSLDERLSKSTENLDGSSLMLRASDLL